MKTPDTTQEDMSFVDLAEGKLAQAPAVHVENEQQRDARFTVAPISEPQSGDRLRIEEISNNLSQSGEKAPAVKEISSSSEKGQEALELGEKLFGKNFGRRMGLQYLENNPTKLTAEAIRSSESTAKDLKKQGVINGALGLSLVAAQVLMYGEIGMSVAQLAAAGLSGPLGIAVIASIPTVGTLAFASYAGYKVFKNWKAKKQFRETVGKSYDEALVAA